MTLWRRQLVPCLPAVYVEKTMEKLRRKTNKQLLGGRRRSVAAYMSDGEKFVVELQVIRIW